MVVIQVRSIALQRVVIRRRKVNAIVVVQVRDIAG